MIIHRRHGDVCSQVLQWYQTRYPALTRRYLKLTTTEVDGEPHHVLGAFQPWALAELEAAAQRAERGVIVHTEDVPHYPAEAPVAPSTGETNLRAWLS